MSFEHKEDSNIVGLVVLLLIIAMGSTTIIIVLKGFTRDLAIFDNYTSVSCNNDTPVFDGGVQATLPSSGDVVSGRQLYLKYNKIYAAREKSFQYKIKPGENCKLVEIPITQALKDSLLKSLKE